MNRRSFLCNSGKALALAALAPRLAASTPMPANNRIRSLSFSNDWIKSDLVTDIRSFPVPDAIVVNLSSNSLSYTGGTNRGTIAPWKSTILHDCTLDEGSMAALLHVQNRTNLGGIALQWDWFGKRFPDFPRTTPLYISSQDDLGAVEFDPLVVFGSQAPAADSARRYQLKLNLWYTPEETDCGIHTGHQFLEVHTQVLGTGHMQKFRENNAATLYEDVLMPPGFTHGPFFTLQPDRSFSYPWHRYYADTDCIWMAVELHPVT